MSKTAIDRGRVPNSLARDLLSASTRLLNPVAPTSPRRARQFACNQSSSSPVSTGRQSVRIPTPHGSAVAVTAAELKAVPAWKNCFAAQRKDHRYYELVEQTLAGGFEHHYLVLEDHEGRVRGVQPCFLIHQDILAGVGEGVRNAAAWVRRWFPGFLKVRVLMVGCAAGEGHLSAEGEAEARWLAESLHGALAVEARRQRASLVVIKEFPRSYRAALATFSDHDYTRIPSMPMVRLELPFASFEEYLSKKISKVSRHSLRRKFKKLADVPPIEMQVVNDVTPYVDEVHPLYLQVFSRSKMTFEKLTKEFLCQLGQRMPERTRFFIWRQNGRAIGFSVCLVHDGAIYDEYLGLEYPLALDLHLYFVTLRDIIQWAVTNGCTRYCSSALNYDPKLHLKCELAPLDLYVRHTSAWMNPFFRRLLPVLEPTHRDPTLRKFPNAHEL